ncbi:MAG TPA: response regulator [Firmicutes bacterium]|jgi:DNA-binding response OmpR family regulator|nr:response regulator [Bacillota bacterium]
MPKKILLVEDEKNIILGVKTCLEVANYDVLVVEDGEEAIETAIREKPDLILLDLMLPKLDGYAVCQDLKSREGTNNIPIVVLTAKVEEESRKRAMEVGADSYMTKPFRPEELWQEIKKFIH